jgi:hypothetical protein
VEQSLPSTTTIDLSKGTGQLDLFGAPVGTKPVVRPDGSVQGCTLIYAPPGQAGEFAPLALNPYRGCGHSCSYPCYVPEFTRQPRDEFNAGAVLKPDFIARLRKEAAKYQAAGITEQVTLSFSTDPYHPGDTTPTRETLEILIEHGLAFCTLTKGGTRALRDLDLFRRDRDCYAATLIGDDRLSKKWESNAPVSSDRIAALKTFFEAGIFVYASLEPMIDPAATMAVVEATHSFVDLFKLGQLNHSKLPRTFDRRDLTLRMLDLFNRLNARHYIKRDLQPFLPPGYPNPMRIPQHHGEAHG